MRKVPADQTARRIHRQKSRRNRFWAGVAFAAIFAVLFSLAASGLSLLGGENHAAGSGEHAAIKKGTGHIVKVASDNCSKIDFNNLDGRFSDQRYIPCPEGRHINRDYQLPSNRIESFSKSFSK